MVVSGTEHRNYLIGYRCHYFSYRRRVLEVPDGDLMAIIKERSEKNLTRFKKFSKISIIPPELMACIHEFVYREQRRKDVSSDLSEEHLL